MRTVDPRSPCLVGVAQRTWRGDGDAPEPLDMWEHVCREAAADAGSLSGVLKALDRLDIVYCQSWEYDDPPRRLAERLGAATATRRYAGIGGVRPQLLVQEAAHEILSGETDLVLVCGAEALATRRRMRREGRRPDWSHRPAERSPFPFEDPPHPSEVTHDVHQAWLTFALFDVARRARMGVEPDAYRDLLGQTLAPLTDVAARNPHSWFPIARSTAEIVTPTPENRMVGYPYTKYMVSIMDVDMAAAVVVASHAAADRLGVPADRRVYLRGWCSALDPHHVAAHPDLSASPAMAEASSEALRSAGATLDDVAHLDLYSCFASSIGFARDALGLPTGDARAVTVTGGLPYFGGPGSNYMTHALASMVDTLRSDSGSIGLVSGVGMHMSKHVWAVYSTEPGPVAPPDAAAVQARVDRREPTAIREAHSGDATIATYSVVHDRKGSPTHALLVCDLGEGERCYARADDPELLVSLEGAEWVGSTVALATGEDGVNSVVG